jgi:hypothetical protein
MYCSGPPDGLFLVKMKDALKIISDNAASAEKPVIIRMMVRSPYRYIFLILLPF